MKTKVQLFIIAIFICLAASCTQEKSVDRVLAPALISHFDEVTQTNGKYLIEIRSGYSHVYIDGDGLYNKNEIATIKFKGFDFYRYGSSECRFDRWIDLKTGETISTSPIFNIKMDKNRAIGLVIIKKSVF
ncbi:MAG: hypothetical protein ACRCZQ_05580 [Bacteroidales bacterium]